MFLKAVHCKNIIRAQDCLLACKCFFQDLFQYWDACMQGVCRLGMLAGFEGQQGGRKQPQGQGKG
jgi:hypothetical protein